MAARAHSFLAAEIDMRRRPPAGQYSVV